MDQASVRTAKRRAVQKAAQKAAERYKCTILLEPLVSRKLSIAADMQDKDRSEVVNALLAEALSYIVITVRGQKEVSASPDAQASHSEAEAA